MDEKYNYHLNANFVTARKYMNWHDIIQEAWRDLGDEEQRARWTNILLGMLDSALVFRYNAQLANNKLDAEQDAAIAATFKLQDLGDCQDGDIGVRCR